MSKNIDLVRSAVQDAVVMNTGVKHIRVANIYVQYYLFVLCLIFDTLNCCLFLPLNTHCAVIYFDLNPPFLWKLQSMFFSLILTLDTLNLSRVTQEHIVYMYHMNFERRCVCLCVCLLTLVLFLSTVTSVTFRLLTFDILAIRME